MEPDVRFAHHEDLLQPAEFIRIARIAESLGVHKIRITGGEPTLHPHLTDIIAGIRQSTNVEIALITNASRLTPDSLREWKQAGLARITISIDTLQPARFARLTRSTTSPEQVLAGIEMCLAESLTPLKLNAVLIRGLNDDEAPDLAQLARRYGIQMRFIEYMPLDSASAWDPSKYVPASETLAAIESRYKLVATGQDEESSTSKTYAFADGTPGLVGFIAPVSSPFCGACSRLRLTADGKVRPCLFSTREWDLRSMLRDAVSVPTDEQIADFLIDAAWSKQAGHGISSQDFTQPARPMSAIGG